MTLPETMTAIGHPGPRPLSAADALVAMQIPVPAPGPRDLLVRVRAAAANPIDAKLRAGGKASADHPRILGFEAAGEVVAVGSGVRHFEVGDLVFHPGQIDRPGTFADFTRVDERIAGPMPKSLGFEDAAALPLTGLTAFELLFEQMGIAEGTDSRKGPDSQVLLIINGAGGVGSIAIQLVRALTGMTVVATASRPESEAWCRAMGAHHVISHHQPLSQGLAALGLDAVDYVASLSNTADNMAEIIRCLRPFGMLGMIDQPATLDAMPLRTKAQRLAFEGVFVRALMKTPDMGRQGDILRRLSAMVDAGQLKTTRHDPPLPLDLDGVREGQMRMEAGTAIGKIVHRAAG